MKKLIFFAISLAVFLSTNSFSQPSEGGSPYSFKHKEFQVQYSSITLEKPNMEQVLIEDAESEIKGELHKIGRSVYTNINLNNSGTWTNLPNGDRIWQLKIMVPDAQALVVYYDNFWLPAGAKLFLYNENQKQILGAYTESNNPPAGYFANEMIQGESVTLEYYEPSRTKGFSIINISAIGYIYRDAHFLAKYNDNQYKEFNTSDACEVNVNCPEGANWQDQKKGVARILVVEGGMQGFCTGSLINNVRQDCTPYFLTADHCGENSSTSDLNQWVFYFNYESSTCVTQATEPTANTLTGCSLKAHGGNGGQSGSDFYLVQLTTAPTFNPFYNGWDRSTTGSASGVSLHHPDGDIMKISTYTGALSSSDYNGSGVQSHWRVVWAATVTNHGVTEPGSSGSPIFNASKRIVGDLTGGASYCTALNSPDYYGKISYSWDQNGTTAAVRLKDWLDPDNTNVMSLDGFYCGGGSSLVANFSGNPLAVAVGGTVTFTDLSTGSPTTWAWSANPSAGVTYAGGTSAASQNPQMTFANAGLYSITLTASKTGSTDTETKTNYITVGNVPPHADFIGIPQSIPVGGSVNFTDQSAGVPTSWAWTFQGAVTTSSALQNPTNIVYNAVGLYPVKLKVSNANGSDSITKTNYINVSDNPQPVTPCDTFNMPLHGTAVLYSINYPGGVKGYISGTNGYSDKAKANYYVPSAPYNKLSGVLFKFGKGRKIPSSATNVVFAVWDNSGLNGSPGANPIATDTVYLGDIIANVAGHNYSYVDFGSSQPIVNTPVYIGVYLPTGTGDTLALLTNKNGETFPGIAWEQWRNDAWFNYSDSSSWKYNVAHAIFPIFCDPNAGISEFTPGDNILVYPNPATGSINIAFIDNPKSNLTVNIYNIVGQKVNSTSFNGQTRDIFNIDISTLKNGIYIINIETEGKIITKKISVLN
jgi:PKD repeat protein